LKSDKSVSQTDYTSTLLSTDSSVKMFSQKLRKVILISLFTTTSYNIDIWAWRVDIWAWRVDIWAWRIFIRFL